MSTDPICSLRLWSSAWGLTVQVNALSSSPHGKSGDIAHDSSILGKCCSAGGYGRQQRLWLRGGKKGKERFRDPCNIQLVTSMVTEKDQNRKQNPAKEPHQIRPINIIPKKTSFLLLLLSGRSIYFPFLSTEHSMKGKESMFLFLEVPHFSFKLKKYP